jgi:hypothetical protein
MKSSISNDKVIKLIPNIIQMKIFNANPYSLTRKTKKSPIGDILRNSFNMNMQNQKVLDTIVSAKIDNVSMKLLICRVIN